MFFISDIGDVILAKSMDEEVDYWCAADESTPSELKFTTKWSLVPGTKPVIDKSSLFWYRKNTMEEEGKERIVPLSYWQSASLEIVEQMTLAGVAEHRLQAEYITSVEILNMWHANSPIQSLQVFKAIVVNRNGNFPMPGWHPFMIASGYLDSAVEYWRGFEGYDEWIKWVVTPKPGKAYDVWRKG